MNICTRLVSSLNTLYNKVIAFRLSLAECRVGNTKFSKLGQEVVTYKEIFADLEYNT